MTFADQLKFYRRELKLTQAELSELLDVPARTLWDWESGKTEPLSVAQEGATARMEQARIRANWKRLLPAPDRASGSSTN